jgi:hypothetical protein
MGASIHDIPSCVGMVWPRSPSPHPRASAAVHESTAHPSGQGPSRRRQGAARRPGPSRRRHCGAVQPLGCLREQPEALGAQRSDAHHPPARRAPRHRTAAAADRGAIATGAAHKACPARRREEDDHERNAGPFDGGLWRARAQSRRLRPTGSAAGRPPAVRSKMGPGRSGARGRLGLADTLGRRTRPVAPGPKRIRRACRATTPRFALAAAFDPRPWAYS